MHNQIKFIKNDNPKTYWIILKRKPNEFIEDKGRRVTFNVQIHDDEPFLLWKTRKWARKVARETKSDDLLIYRTIIPVDGEYYQWGEKEIYAKDILIKNDKCYEP